MSAHTELDRFGAFLLDLDGVLTPTVELHMRAWRELFEPILADHGVRGYDDLDYFRHLDGRQRFAGVDALLRDRGIALAWGSEDDAPDAGTVCGVGNRKNATFTRILREEGIRAYPGSLRFLDWLAAAGIPAAVVSSSRNAVAVLTAAGLGDRFSVVIDGLVAEELGLRGKPAPDTYARAAAELGVAPERAVVIEDALSGVAAGAAGGFGLVIGVDRGAGHDSLITAGAALTVTDLGELLP